MAQSVRKDQGFSVPAELEPHYSTFKRVFDNLGPVFHPYPNEVELLINGESTFESIFAAIEKAESYILVQYYILRADKLGSQLKDLLIAKARTGVEVFLLYDDMGSFWLSKLYTNALRKAGINVARFLPVTSYKRFFQINFRNHRKLVVVDGECAFTGGLNVGDEYLIANKLYWRDTHIKVVGPAVRQLEEVFVDDWFFAARKKIRLKPSQSMLRELPDALQKPLPENPAYVQVVPSGPTDQHLVGMLLFLHAIGSAKQKLWFATPYFVPDQAVLQQLELAARRGVDVRILIPKESDVPMVSWVSLSYAEQVAKQNVRVYRYSRGFMHSKVLVIDDSTTVIGTSNFDNRALYLNFETSLVVHQREFNRQATAMLEQDFLDSEQLIAKDVAQYTTLHRMQANLARLMAPLM